MVEGPAAGDDGWVCLYGAQPNVNGVAGSSHMPDCFMVDEQN